MKGLWRKYLGLSAASLLAASVQAADLEPIAAAPPRPVIARAGGSGSSFATAAPNPTAAKPSPLPGSAASIGRPASSSTLAPALEIHPLAVTLERPRTGEFGIQRTAFQEGVRPVVRAQASELIPSHGSIGPTRMAAAAPEPAPGLAMLPAPMSSAEDFAMMGGAIPDGIAEDRFGIGDGMTHEFNNFLSIDTEYLLWHMRGADSPPLLANFQPGLPAPAMPMVLFGGKSEDTDMHSGLRTRLTLWADRDHAIGFDLGYFFLAQGSMDFSRFSSGMPLLAVPLAGGGSFPLASLADGSVGGARSALMNRLWGTEANMRANVLAGPCSHLDLLAGFRGLGLDDNFDFNTTSILRSGTFTQVTRDSFSTRNRFYGGQLGAEAEWRCRRWSLGLSGKVGIGSTTQQVETSGITFLNGIRTPGGIFAGTANRLERDRFSFVPELGVKVGYQVTSCIRASLGYNFLYWSNVVRATEQISPLLGGPGQPFKTSDFWAQGLTAGLELRY